MARSSTRLSPSLHDLVGAMACVVFLLLGASDSAVQTVDIRLDTQATSPVDYTTPDPVRVQGNSAVLGGTVRFETGERTYLIPGLTYRVLGLRYIESTTVPEVPLLHWPEVSLALLHVFTNGWSVYAQATAALAGDLVEIDPDVSRYGGSLLFTRSFSSAFSLGFGGAASYVFGRLLAFPLLSVNWAITDRLKLQTTLPVNASLSYALGERSTLGWEASLVGNQYAMRDETFVAGFCDTSGTSDACVDNISSTGITSGVFATRALIKGDPGEPSLSVELHLGLNVFRRFQMFTADRTALEGPAARLPNAGSARLRLRYVR